MEFQGIEFLNIKLSVCPGRAELNFSYARARILNSRRIKISTGCITLHLTKKRPDDIMYSYHEGGVNHGVRTRIKTGCRIQG